MGFFIIIAILVIVISLSINIWRKSKHSNYRKAVILIFLWIITLIIELILINIYFTFIF